MVWRQRYMGGPLGGVRVRWDAPTPATALAVEVGWDADRGGSAAAVLEALNGLVGWPVLRRAV